MHRGWRMPWRSRDCWSFPSCISFLRSGRGEGLPGVSICRCRRKGSGMPNSSWQGRQIRFLLPPCFLRAIGSPGRCFGARPSRPCTSLSACFRGGCEVQGRCIPSARDRCRAGWCVRCRRGWSASPVGWSVWCLPGLVCLGGIGRGGGV